jgi:hypothetical protein
MRGRSIANFAEDKEGSPLMADPPGRDGLDRFTETLRKLVGVPVTLVNVARHT